MTETDKEFRTWKQVKVGTLRYSIDDIVDACRITGDSNPIHHKLRVVPFFLPLGSAAALAYDWAVKRKLLKIAFVQGLQRVKWFGVQELEDVKWLDEALKADRDYPCYASFHKRGKCGEIQIEIKDLTGKPMITGTIKIRCS